MADQKVSVEIEVQDKFTEALNQMNQSLNKFNDNLEKTKGAGDKTNSSMEKFAATARQAAGAFAGFSVLSTALTEFKNADVAINKLNRAFENSKGAVGVTKKELLDLGKTLEDKSLFSGESIAAMQQKFISFGNIGGDVFTRANQLALDFATATGKDAAGAAAMLGKALSNPSEGLAALSREGVKFNDEQERMIKKMIDSGRVTDAQNLILDELNKKYSGMSESATQGAGGIDMMNKKFGQLVEVVGQQVFAVIQPFVEFINNQVMPVLMKFGDEIGIIITILGSLVVGINAVSLAMSLLTKSNLILLAISAAVYGVVKAFQNWDAIVEFVAIGFQKLKLLALEVVRVMANFTPALMPFKKEFDSMIENAKVKIADLEKEKTAKADKRRADELAAEKKAADDEAEAKLKANQAYNNKIAKVNKGNIDEAARKAAEQKNQKSDEEILIESEAKRKKIAKEMAIINRRKELMKKYKEQEADNIIEQEQRVADESNAINGQKLAIENNIGTARFDAAQDFFSNMSQLQNSKTREMFEIGKAAAVGSAVMNTYEGITATLAKYPFPLSAAMAAAQGALGFAQVSNIASQSFENGGVVGGFVGATPGRDNTQVNARVGEMFLTPRQQKNLFDKIDSSGNNTTQASSQTVIYQTNVKMYGNGDKSLKKMMEKTIENREKRKLQKQQFVKGRFST